MWQWFESDRVILHYCDPLCCRRIVGSARTPHRRERRSGTCLHCARCACVYVFCMRMHARKMFPPCMHVCALDVCSSDLNVARFTHLTVAATALSRRPHHTENAIYEAIRYYNTCLRSFAFAARDVTATSATSPPFAPPTPPFIQMSKKDIEHHRRERAYVVAVALIRYHHG